MMKLIKRLLLWGLTGFMAYAGAFFSPWLGLAFGVGTFFLFGTLFLTFSSDPSLPRVAAARDRGHDFTDDDDSLFHDSMSGFDGGTNFSDLGDPLNYEIVFDDD